LHEFDGAVPYVIGAL